MNLFDDATQRFDEALGETLWGGTPYELAPGEQSPYHWHCEAGAHRLRGAGRVAIFSTRRQGTVMYPDSGKVGAGPPWDRLYLRRADAVDYWSD